MATNNSAKRYPTKADISRALNAARQLDLKIDGFEVGPRGVIRVFVDDAGSASENAYEQWARARKRSKQAIP